MEALVENTHHSRKRIIWGVILIGVGCMFLLERMDLLEISGFWHLWPIFIALSGVVDVLAATRIRHITRGFNQIIIGTWLFACLEHLWGCTFGNSWPILLIGFGMCIAVDGMVASSKKSNTGSLQ